MDLSADEMRVLGSLVEKQLTTPQQYPLTLNALDPGLQPDDESRSGRRLRRADDRGGGHQGQDRGLARFVHPSHGRSALRYAHTLDEALGLDTRPLALLTVLMLRGPQTLGELRTRTERMVRFADLHEVQAELDALATRTEPLVVAPGREAGAERGPLRPAAGRPAGHRRPDAEHAGRHAAASPTPITPPRRHRPATTEPADRGRGRRAATARSRRGGGTAGRDGGVARRGRGVAPSARRPPRAARGLSGGWAAGGRLRHDGTGHSSTHPGRRLVVRAHGPPATSMTNGGP